MRVAGASNADPRDRPDSAATVAHRDECCRSDIYGLGDAPGRDDISANCDSFAVADSNIDLPARWTFDTHSAYDDG